MNLQRLIPRALLLIVIAVAVLWAAFHRDQFDADFVDQWLAGFGLWAPVIYVLLFAIGTIVFLPGSLFALAGGALFGPVWGAILNLLGATMGASFAFLIARYLAGDWVARKSGGHLKRLVDGVEKEGWRFVAFVRLVPLFPFNLTNYALGLTRIGFWPYVLASFICMAPGAIAFSWLGYAGQGALSGDASAIRYGLYALGLLAAIAFVPRLVRRKRKGGTNWIEAEDLQKQLSGGKSVKVIDVRGPDEFAGDLGHIPGAMNIPLGEIPGRLSEINAFGGRPLIMVCKTEMRSARAAEILTEAGSGDVRVLRGGMIRWRQAGFGIEGQSMSRQSA